MMQWRAVILLPDTRTPGPWQVKGVLLVPRTTEEFTTVVHRALIDGWPYPESKVTRTKVSPPSKIFLDGIQVWRGGADPIERQRAVEIAVMQFDRPKGSTHTGPAWSDPMIAEGGRPSAPGTGPGVLAALAGFAAGYFLMRKASGS